MLKQLPQKPSRLASLIAKLGLIFIFTVILYTFLSGLHIFFFCPSYGRLVYGCISPAPAPDNSQETGEAEELVSINFFFASRQDGQVTINITLPEHHGIPFAKTYQLRFSGQVSVAGKQLPFGVYRLLLDTVPVARVIIRLNPPRILSLSTPNGVWLYKDDHETPIPNTERALEDFLLSLAEVFI